jgi:hypothetical protein
MLQQGSRVAVTASEAAHILGKSVETVRYRLKQGKLAGFRKDTGDGRSVWYVDASALPAQSVPENAPGIVDDAPSVAPVSDGVVEALTAHIDDLRGQLSAQSTAHAAEISRLVDAQSEQIVRLREDHAREVATLRDVNRDQYVILERLSVPRLPDSQSTTARPWWRIW